MVNYEQPKRKEAGMRYFWLICTLFIFACNKPDITDYSYIADSVEDGSVVAQDSEPVPSKRPGGSGVVVWPDAGTTTSDCSCNNDTGGVEVDKGVCDSGDCNSNCGHKGCKCVDGGSKNCKPKPGC